MAVDGPLIHFNFLHVAVGGTCFILAVDGSLDVYFILGRRWL